MVHCSTKNEVLRRENRSDYPKWYQIGHNMTQIGQASFCNHFEYCQHFAAF